MRKRRRPPKFNRPSRLVAMTLPEDVIGALRARSTGWSKSPPVASSLPSTRRSSSTYPVVSSCRSGRMRPSWRWSRDADFRTWRSESLTDWRSLESIRPRDRSGPLELPRADVCALDRLKFPETSAKRRQKVATPGNFRGSGLKGGRLRLESSISGAQSAPERACRDRCRKRRGLRRAANTPAARGSH